MSIDAMQKALIAIEFAYGGEPAAALEKEAIDALRQAIKRVENPDTDWDGWLKRDVYFEDGEALMHSEPEWVGLTDDEVEEMFMVNSCCDDSVVYEYVARAIEAKLKEKNT